MGRHDVVRLNVVGKGDGLVRTSTGSGVAEVVGRVRGEEPGAVDHVPFRHDVVERFVSVFEAPLELMVAHQEVAFHGRTEHARKQGVAPVLEEATHAKGVALVEGVPAGIAFQFAQEVLPQDVERLALCRLENGVDPTDAGGLGASLEGQGPKARFVAGLFFAVVVDRQSGGLVDGADVRFAGGGQEPVIVAAVHAKGLDFPRSVPIGVPGQVGLGVEVGGGVLPTFVEGGQHVTVVAVAHPHVDAHGPRHIVVLDLGAQGTRRHPGRWTGGLAVMDVEHGAEFVPVFGLKSSSAEFNAVHHVGVGERQALLLAGAHQEGAVDFDVIDIDQILVKGPPADVVCTAQFRGEVDRGLEQGVLDGPTRGGDFAGETWVDALHRDVLGAVAHHFGLTQVGARGELEALGHVGALKGDALGFAAVADKRRFYCPGAFAWKDDAELPVPVCGDAQSDVFFHQHGGAGQDLATCVGDGSGQGELSIEAGGEKPSQHPEPQSAQGHCRLRSPSRKAFRNLAQATGFNKLTGGACPE